MIKKPEITLNAIRIGILLNIMIVLFLVNSTSILANSISSGSPWSLELDGKIRIESIPYNPYGDCIGFGITKVFKKNRLLYSIEGYSPNSCIADTTGEYLAFIFPWITQKDLNSTKYDDVESGNLNRTDGEVIKIFKEGKFLKSFNFHELNIDTSMLVRDGNVYYWKSMNEKITHFPAYFKENTLRIATVDNQILNFELTDVVKFGTEIFTTKSAGIFANRISSRKIKGIEIDYPELKAFPRLRSGQTIETGLSELFDLIATQDADGVVLWVRIDVLLINKEGKCEKCYVSANRRDNNVSPYESRFNTELGKKIEGWIYQQSYETKLIPKLLDKYAFSSRGPINFKRKSG